jgi:hypothetical protein
MSLYLVYRYLILFLYDGCIKIFIIRVKTTIYHNIFQLRVITFSIVIRFFVRLFFWGAHSEIQLGCPDEIFYLAS